MKTLIVVMIALFSVPMTQASVATSFGVSEKDAANMRGAFEYIIANADNASEEGKILRSRKIIELNKMFNDAMKSAGTVEKQLIEKYNVKNSISLAFRYNAENSAKSRSALKKNAETFLSIVK